MTEEWPEHDYRFTPSKELEFRARGGTYRLASGCSGQDWFTFNDLIDQVDAMCLEASDEQSIEQLYLFKSKFRQYCDRILNINGIEPKWTTPSIVRWLIFSRVQGNEIVIAPLRQLNEPPKPKLQSAPKKDKEFSRASLIAAVATHCGGDLSKAYELMSSAPFVELMRAMECSAWNSSSGEEKHKQRFEDWKIKKKSKAPNMLEVAASGRN